MRGGCFRCSGFCLEVVRSAWHRECLAAGCVVFDCNCTSSLSVHYSSLRGMVGISHIDTQTASRLFSLVSSPSGKAFNRRYA